MSPEQEKKLVTADVEPLLNVIYSKFEAALADIITGYFENRPINWQTVPDVARDKIKLLLTQDKQQKVQYELEDLPRNGLSIIFKGGSCYKKYNLKILFSPDDKLPVAGMKHRKKRILCQKDQLILPWPFKDILSINPSKDNKPETLVLVILWKAKFVNGIAHQNLTLVRTIEGKNNLPVIYWNEPISDPACAIKEEQSPTITDTDDMDDDFGISFNDVS